MIYSECYKTLKNRQDLSNLQMLRGNVDLKYFAIVQLQVI